MFDPLILLLAAFCNVIRPLADCVSPPVALRLPFMKREGAVMFIPVPLNVRLLNSVEPAVVLEMVLLFPVMVTVLALPVKVPLAVQLPATECVALPPLNVAPPSTVTLPVMECERAAAPPLKLEVPLINTLPLMLRLADAVEVAAS